MYNKILVPLDSSPFAECVLEHVKALAAGCKVREVVLLYAVEPLNPGVYEVPLNVVEDADAVGAIRELADLLYQEPVFPVTVPGQSLRLGEEVELVEEFLVVVRRWCGDVEMQTLLRIGIRVVPPFPGKAFRVTAA